MGNWIDRIVGVISPARGYQREAWRQGLEELRNYDAGSHGRLNANWTPQNISAELTDCWQRGHGTGKSKGPGEKLGYPQLSSRSV